MKVRYTPRARDDLEAILNYIDTNSPAGARSVKQTIHRAIELIGEYPEGGRIADPRGIRVLPIGRYPYLLYWTVTGDEVWLLHIRHAARRPWPAPESDG